MTVRRSFRRFFSGFLMAGRAFQLLTEQGHGFMPLFLQAPAEAAVFIPENLQFFRKFQQ
jgi:hypothetical protein